MNTQQAKEKYQTMGLEVRHIIDEPGNTYPAHRHEGVYLLGLKGSAQLRLDENEWQQVLPGQEVHIQDDQLHEAVVGPKGWEYLFAASPEEMQRQGL